MIPAQVKWIKFGTGLLLTAILSLSIHAIMLQQFHVPFPDTSVITKPYMFILRVGSALALLYFWKLAGQKVGRSYVKQWLLLFLIDAMLTESLFRGPFMDGYCSNAIIFMLVSNIPKLLSIAVICGLVVLITPKLHSAWQKLVAAIVITAIYVYAATPLFGAAWAPVLSLIARLAPTSSWCNLPYGPNVLIPAYISYLEPVIACALMALLVWHQLPKAIWMKYLIFILMVLAIKNQLVTPVFYALLGKSSFFSNLLSESQFALEALALAILTGVTMAYSSRQAVNAG